MHSIVDRDAKKLDKVYPGWENFIDLAKLDLATTDCVLFQLYDSYSGGLDALDMTEFVNDGGADGFYLDSNDGTTWSELTDMWVKEVKSRRYSV